MQTSQLTLPTILTQIFEVLGIEAAARDKMTTEVVGLLALTAMNTLLEQKSEDESARIQTELERATNDKADAEKAQIILGYFDKHWDRASIEKANEAAGKELLPKYFKAIFEAATSEQKEKIQSLMDKLSTTNEQTE